VASSGSGRALLAGPAELPASWTGWWVAEDGKAVLLERDEAGVLVSVFPQRGAPPYRTSRFLAFRRRIRRRRASCEWDDRKRFLEIEAGLTGLGPTYRLYPAVEDGSGRRAAPDGTPVEDVILLPNTSIGLYDDFSDDQGVAWAHPLLPLRYAGT